MSFPFVNGYKPSPSLQASLRDRVREEILRRQDLTDIAFAHVTSSVPDALGAATWAEAAASATAPTLTAASRN